MMGQSSSQIAQPNPSQHIGIARTPTPELSDMDRDINNHISNDDANTNDAIEAHDNTIRWSPMNTRKPSITIVDDTLLQPTVVEQSPKATKKPARPRASKKRASDTVQRRLLSPRLAKIVPSVENSEVEQPVRKKRKSLPKAARGEEVPAIKQEAFSPLRKTRLRPPRSPVIQSSPPQVVITASEVEAATTAQALENHAEGEQGELSRVDGGGATGGDIQIQSAAEEQASQGTPDTSAGSKNFLAQVQQQGNDWFSKIDEAKAEVAAREEPIIVTTVTKTVEDEMQVEHHDDMGSHDPENIDQNEPDLAGEYEVESETPDPWPAHLIPRKDEIAERMEQRPFTPWSLEPEELSEDTESAWNVRENGRRMARNVLRNHIVHWHKGIAVYKGLAKNVEDENGGISVVYAEDGETFPIPNWSKAQKRAYKATKNSVRATKEALHQSIVISELEAEMLAKQTTLDDTVLASGGSLSLEAFVAAQSPASTGNADGKNIDEDAESATGMDLKVREGVANDDAKHDHAQSKSEEEVVVEDDPDATESEAEPEAALDAKIDVQNTHDGSVEEAVDTGAIEEVLEGEAQDEGDIAERNVEEVEEEADEKEQAKVTKPAAAASRPTPASKTRTSMPETRDKPTTDPLMRRQRKVSRRPSSELQTAPATARVERTTPAAQGPIPTPPESSDAQQTLAVHPTIVQVEDWLASQDEEPPLPPDELAVDPAKTSRKRKRKSIIEETELNLPRGVAEPEEPEDVDLIAATARPKIKRARKRKQSTAAGMAENSESELPKAKKQKSKSNDAKPKRRVTMSGPFTQEEKETADRIFMDLLERESLEEADLIAEIKSWKTCRASLKDAMFDAFSDRTVESIRKFCQRRWHQLQRGPWTQEEDAALRAAQASHSDQWTKISDQVGRTGPACKDRWRDHLKLKEKTVGPWTVPEEEKLVAAVEECIAMIKEEKNEDDPSLQDREQLEALVNWSVVAKKLTGRSAKRCREKYATIRPISSKRPNKRKSRRSSASQDDGDDEETKNVLHARRVVNGFEIGDYYDIFTEVHSSFDDPHQQFRDEKHVLWSIVSQKNTHSRFALYFRPSTLRRIALENAIATWPASNAKIKRRLDSVETMPAKALVLAKWIEKTNAGRLDTMTRTYKPELIGKSKEDLDALKKANKKKRATGPREKKDRSKDVVSESDEDEINPADTSQANIPSAVLNEDEDVTESEEGEEEEEEGEAANEESAGDDDDEPSNITQDVPDSQFLPSQPLAEGNDVMMADVESLKGTPNISRSDFVDRLKSSGSSRRKTVGYSKKDKLKADRRRRSGR